MDSYEFIASLVGSLAWPALISVVLVLHSKQVAGLMQRLRKLSLPGIVKLGFDKNLEENREITEQIPPDATAGLPSLSPDEEDKLFRLAIDSPEGAMVLAYMDLEKVLRDIAVKLGMGSKTLNQRSVIDALLKRELIKRDTARLFDALRRTRNSAVHAEVDVELTSAEASEYIQQVRLLIGILQGAEANIQLMDPASDSAPYAA
jgi:hypothetical protein